MEVQSESDVLTPLRSLAARQPDTDTFRLWEVAGTSHADVHLVGPDLAKAVNCGAAINDGPMHLVMKAALRQLDTWVHTGKPPPRAPRIKVTKDKPPAIERDADGIAVGGVRTPPVDDVPSVVLSGAPGPSPDLLCILLGSTRSCQRAASPGGTRRRTTTSPDTRRRPTRPSTPGSSWLRTATR